MIATPREITNSLGRGLDEKRLVTNDMAWRPVSHAGAAQLGVGSQMRPESKNLMPMPFVKR